MTLKERTDALARVPVFAGLSRRSLERIARTPVAALEFMNILLTQNDVKVGTTPKDVVWTHRKSTLYRYRSEKRRHSTSVFKFA